MIAPWLSAERQIGEQRLDHAGDADELHDIGFSDSPVQRAKLLSRREVIPVEADTDRTHGAGILYLVHSLRHRHSLGSRISWLVSPVAMINMYTGRARTSSDRASPALQQFDNIRGRNGRARNPYVEGPQRVFDCGNDRRRDRNRAALADAFHAQGIERRRAFTEYHLDIRQFRCSWKEVFGKICGDGLSVVIIAHEFKECVADTVHDTAMDLSCDDERIDKLAAILQRNVAQDAHLSRFGIDLNLADMKAVRIGQGIGPECGAGFETGVEV